MTNYEVKIERGLILWLREVKDITAVSASIGESEVEEGYGGCDTCGYGGTETTVETPIYFRRDGDMRNNTVYIDGTSLDFLSTLLEYIDRAN